mgnify:CR=1 FL=1
MKKVTLVLMLFGAFTFGIAGCGNNNTESETEHKGDGHLHDETITDEKKDHNHTEGKAGHNHTEGDTTHQEGDGHKH